MNLFADLTYIQASAPTNSSENEFVFGRMSAITRYIYETVPTYETAGIVVLILIFILSAIVYKLGFAKNDLSIVKNIIIYFLLFVGCIILTFLALFLPMVEGLIVAAAILILYKTRLWREKREENRANSNSI